jgi:hypothetical protein
MPQVTSIIQGAAELWIDGVNVGFTYEAVNQTLEKEYSDIIVEQIKGPIATVLTMENCNISTVIAEVTLANIQTVWDQAGSSLIGGTFLAIGTEEGANYHTIQIIAKAPASSNKTYRNFYIFKAVSFENTELSSARGEQTKLAVTFKCLKDVNNGNQFGYVTESNVKGG